jgi:TonB family protein
MKLFQYIQGTRRGKEINRLEKEAMKDHFLADALDGFDKIQRNDHELRIKEMRANVLYKIKSGNNHIFRYLSIAASILLFVGSGWYFLLNKNQTGREETQVNLFVQEKTIIEDTTFIDEALQEKRHPAMKIQSEKTLIAQTGINKTDTKPTIKAQIHSEVNKKTPIETITFQEDTTIIPDTALLIEQEVLAEVSDRILITKDEHKIISVNTEKNKVRGMVTDTKGDPLPGAMVMYHGTNTATISDHDGYFELPESKEKKIQINYLGYESVNLVADTNKMMLVAMTEDTNVMNEVAVVAFGTQKKGRAVTGLLGKKENSTPEPIIGKKEYKKYLKENIIIPQSEDCKGKKGKVTLKFMIDLNGRPTNIRVKKSLCPEADKEAIRLIEQGPGWTVSNKDVEIKVRFK